MVTQRFHMARALYGARRAGLEVTGYAADRRDYGRVMPRLRVREAAARVKSFGDAVTGAEPHFLGAANTNHGGWARFVGPYIV